MVDIQPCEADNPLRVDRYTTKSLVIFGTGTEDHEVKKWVETQLDAKWDAVVSGWIFSNTKAKNIQISSVNDIHNRQREPDLKYWLNEPYTGLIGKINYFNYKFKGQWNYYIYVSPWLRGRTPLKNRNESQNSAFYYDTSKTHFITPDGRRFKLLTILIEEPTHRQIEK